jgi:uncharacterized protein YndB with AHSA1/START domain
MSGAKSKPGAMDHTWTMGRKGEREMVAERMLDAPPARVYAAMNDPALVPKWWGPARFKTQVEQMDVGGRWRILHHGDDGSVYAFHGEYRELTPISKIVRTFVFEGAPQEQMVETITLIPEGKRTRIQMHALFLSVEGLEGMVGSGMEEGMRESWERLAALLA